MDEKRIKHLQMRLSMLERHLPEIRSLSIDECLKKAIDMEECGQKAIRREDNFCEPEHWFQLEQEFLKAAEIKEALGIGN